MQKVVHVWYSKEVQVDEMLRSINAYLAQGWKVVMMQSVKEVVATGHDDCIPATGDYGITFVIEKMD